MVRGGWVFFFFLEELVVSGFGRGYRRFWRVGCGEEVCDVFFYDCCQGWWI